jgi:hypothetical protein
MATNTVGKPEKTVRAGSDEAFLHDESYIELKEYILLRAQANEYLDKHPRVACLIGNVIACAEGLSQS